MPSTGITASAVVDVLNCKDVLLEPFDNMSAWTGFDNTADEALVAGRTSTGLKAIGYGASVKFHIPEEKQSDIITIGFAYKRSSVAEQSQVIGLYQGSQRITRMVFSTPGTFAIARDPAGVSFGSAGGYSVNTWYYVEIQVCLRSSTATGWAKVRINGVMVIDVTNVQTGGLDGVYTDIELGSQSSNTLDSFWDDMYISTGSTCWFKGDQHVGSCTSVLLEPFNDLTSWTTVTGTPVITGGRTGKGLKLPGAGASVQFAIPSAKQDQTITMGFAYRATFSLTSTNPIVEFYRLVDSTSNASNYLNIDSARKLQWVSGASINGTAPDAFVPNKWYYIELKYRMHDTQGTVEVLVDGKTVIGPLTGIDTKASYISGNTIDAIRLKTVWYDQLYDDMYITAGSGCLPKGDQEITTNCTEVFSDSFDDNTNFPGGNIVAGGRSGTCINYSGSGGSSSNHFPAQASYYVTLGFAYKTNLVGTVVRGILSFRDNGGGDLATLHIATSGALELRVGNGGTLIGSGGTITTGVWHFIEANIFFSNTGAVGYATVKLNGNEVINVTGVNTYATVVGPCDSVFLRGAGSGGSVQFDDMYMKTGSGCGFGEDPNVCNPVLQEPFDNFTDGPWVMGTIDVTQDPVIVGGGRNGSGARTAGRSYLYYRIPKDYQSTVTTLGFAWKVNSVIDNFITGWESPGADGNVLQVGLVSNSSGGFSIKRYDGTALGATLGTSAGGLYTADTWCYIEMQVKVASFGFAKLRVNGTLVINATSVDTRNMSLSSLSNKVYAFGLGSTDPRIQTIDDLYVSAGAACAWQGDHVPFTKYEKFNDLAAWNNVNNVTIQTGRTGTAARSTAANSRADFTIPSVSETDVITVGFAFRASGYSSDRPMMELCSDSAATTHLYFLFGSGGIFVYRGNVVQHLGTAVFSPVANTWYYVEIKAKLHDTLGEVIVRIDGVEKFNVANMASRDTKNGGTKTTFDTVKLKGQIGFTEDFDDMYISMGYTPFKGNQTLT